MGQGSLRQRGEDAWELRVYQGIDPDTRRQRWLTKTVHGTQRFARRAHEDVVAEADRARIRAGTLADLLDRWFEAASPGWAAPTVRHTRSVIDCYLKPHLGHLDLGKLTAADIDDFYGFLLRAGSRREGPLAAGTVARVYGRSAHGTSFGSTKVARPPATGSPGRRCGSGSRRRVGCGS